MLRGGRVLVTWRGDEKGRAFHSRQRRSPRRLECTALQVQPRQANPDRKQRRLSENAWAAHRIALMPSRSRTGTQRRITGADGRIGGRVVNLFTDEIAKKQLVW